MNKKSSDRSDFTKMVIRNIRAVLKEKGIKIVDLAETLGVSQPAISGTLSEGSPSLDKLNDIANAIGVSPSELIADESTPGFFMFLGKVGCKTYCATSTDELRKIADEIDSAKNNI